MITRRNVVRGAAAVLTSGALGASSARSLAANAVTLPFENGERPLQFVASTRFRLAD